MFKLMFCCFFPSSRKKNDVVVFSFFKSTMESQGNQEKQGAHNTIKTTRLFFNINVKYKNDTHFSCVFLLLQYVWCVFVSVFESKPTYLHRSALVAVCCMTNLWIVWFWLVFCFNGLCGFTVWNSFKFVWLLL